MTFKGMSVYNDFDAILNSLTKKTQINHILEGLMSLPEPCTFNKNIDAHVAAYDEFLTSFGTHYVKTNPKR